MYYVAYWAIEASLYSLTALMLILVTQFGMLLYSCIGATTTLRYKRSLKFVKVSSVLALTINIALMAIVLYSAGEIK